MSKSAPLASSFEGFLVVGLVGIVLAAILWPVFASAKAAAGTSRCVGNLRMMARGVGLYAEDHDHFVDASRWSDLLLRRDVLAGKYDEPHEFFTCIDSTGIGFSYAMNEALSRKRFSALSHPESQLLFFDSKVLMPNAHGSTNLLPDPPRHGGVNRAIYVDGHLGNFRKDEGL